MTHSATWDYSKAANGYKSLSEVVKSRFIRPATSAKQVSVIGHKRIMDQIINHCTKQYVTNVNKYVTETDGIEELVFYAILNDKIISPLTTNFDAYHLDSLENEVIILFGDDIESLKLINLPEENNQALPF